MPDLPVSASGDGDNEDVNGESDDAIDAEASEESGDEATRALVERDLADKRKFISGLTEEDIHSGAWFPKLIAYALATYTEKVDYRYFQEKYKGLPPDAIVEKRIKLAANYAGLEGVISSGLYSASEFRDEVLTDLTCVILDSGDLADACRLAERLTRRAHSRAARRNLMSQQRAATELAIDGSLELFEPVPSVEGQVVARIQMEHVRELLEAALASGELPEYVWHRFRDFRLAPLFGFDRPAFNRRRVHDNGIEVRQHLAHAS